MEAYFARSFPRFAYSVLAVTTVIQFLLFAAFIIYSYLPLYPDAYIAVAVYTIGSSINPLNIFPAFYP